MSKANVQLSLTTSTRGFSSPVLLAQAGRDGLTNYKFVLEAPWKACRLCGSVYQSNDDRRAYELAKAGLIDKAIQCSIVGQQRRQRWEQLHNRRKHPNYDNQVAHLHKMGLPVMPEAAGVLSTYGIVLIGMTPLLDEVTQALAEAPRAPVLDAEGSG